MVPGDISGWGDEFRMMSGLAVFLEVPADIRMNRIDIRENARWGDIIREGGDMYESRQKFRDFAATRDVALLEQAATLYLCPVLLFDGTQKLRELTAFDLLPIKNNIFIIIVL